MAPSHPHLAFLHLLLLWSCGSLVRPPPSFDADTAVDAPDRAFKRFEDAAESLSAVAGSLTSALEALMATLRGTGLLSTQGALAEAAPNRIALDEPILKGGPLLSLEEAPVSMPARCSPRSLVCTLRMGTPLQVETVIRLLGSSVEEVGADLAGHLADDGIDAAIAFGHHLL